LEPLNNLPDNKFVGSDHNRPTNTRLQEIAHVFHYQIAQWRQVIFANERRNADRQRRLARLCVLMLRDDDDFCLGMPA
jgi:hypothetical protein